MALTDHDPYARALLYAEQNADFVEDLPVWSRIAQEHCPPGGPILELGCGTGRVSFALAREGYHVRGIDLSTDMIACCEAHAGQTDLGQRLSFQVADFRTYRTGTTFPLVIVPFNSICHALSRDDFSRTMATIRHSLAPGGICALHVFAPLGRFLDTVPGSLRQVAEFWSPSRERNFEVFETNTYDPWEQINHIQWFYSSDDPDDEMFEVRYTLRVYHPQELVRLLELHGFRILKVLGDWDGGEPDAESLSYTFVCTGNNDHGPR